MKTTNSSNVIFKIQISNPPPLHNLSFFAVSHLFLLFSLSTRHPSASLYPNTNPNLSLDPLPPLRLQSPTIWFVFRNTCRDTDNLTSDGSPVHRLIDQHSVDYCLWADLIGPESVRLLKTLETECSRKVYVIDVIGAIPDELWSLTYLTNFYGIWVKII
ncbi:hypothetical protein OIU74_005151 [Salix koriyanagi]|uniref:Uncharacterized protein n=1 Tax=Salix koriyanagi TaxID=2511006 RepID=A0A9Q0ZG87_9ROSI|nr:hypothetical protein OIU74_005151 [Salix koriyanagi]